MKRISIRVKVLVALSACLLLGVAGTILLMRISFANNAQVLATESVNRSARLFQILEAREISKMTAVGAAMATNPELRQVFEKQDRQKLLD